MKKLILATAVICMGFASITEPVTNFNGVYYGQQGNRVVTLGWNTQYVGSPYTIKRNGTVIANGYNQQVNIKTFEVESNFKRATFSISQTVNGVTSQEVFTTVSK